MLLFVLVGGVALALGWLSRFLYVVLLPGIALGVIAGAISGFFGLISGSWTPLVQRLSLGLAVLLGFSLLATMDDMHHVDAFRTQVALTVYADSGADGAPLSDEELDFFARGADEVLRTNMEASLAGVLWPGGYTEWMEEFTWLLGASPGHRSNSVIVFLLFDLV